MAVSNPKPWEVDETIARPTSNSWIELSVSSTARNLNFIRSLTGPKIRISSVVKGNAYGHGIEDFVSVAENCGIRHFSVFDETEAYRVLRCKRPESDVMIMGMVHRHELEWAVQNDVEFYVFDFDRLEGALEAAKSQERPARIHIEIETGLNRTGFHADELDRVGSMLEGADDLFVFEGICTHFAGAESVSNYLRIQEQIRRFRDGCEWFEARGFQPRFRHAACSAALLLYPETALDMVRVGILQYGFWPTRETRIHYVTRHSELLAAEPLRRVLTWKSTIMGLREVPQDEFVGYGTHFLTARPTRIATIPVGYSHGYARSLSNQGHVLVGGCRAPVVGIVNMNLMIVDVTDVPSVEIGDEVVLIGDQGDQSISVGSFSELSEQLNYEMLTRLPAQIPRRHVS